jgi:serine/threonine-protein kinase
LHAEGLVGQVLCGKWRIDQLIATGGSSAVYGATHRNGRQVALKVLRSDYAADRLLRHRFLREAYLANQVAHPGTVTILDDDVSQEGLVFLVMERLDGITLDKLLLRDGPLPLAAALAFALDTLEVLSAAHKAGVVHRDVKPANLFRTDQGQIKVLDFGLAELFRGRERILTMPGSALGTPGFMAPEQVRGRSELVDARADVWGVGATVHALLTGRPPHDGAGRAGRMISTLATPILPLRELVPSVPAEVAAVVDCALGIDRAERWPDAGAMLQALRAAIAPTSQLAEPSLVTPKRHGATRAAAVALGVLLAFGVAALWWGAHRPRIAAVQSAAVALPPASASPASGDPALPALAAPAALEPPRAAATDSPAAATTDSPPASRGRDRKPSHHKRHVAPTDPTVPLDL